MSDITDVSQEVQNETTRDFFLFEIDLDLYAIPVSDIDQVMKIPPITPVPNAPRAIVGIFHLRGGVVVVMDLIARMHMERQRPLTANYLFVVHKKNDHFGILVDRPKTIVRVKQSDIRNLDPVVAAHVPDRYVEGMFVFEEAVAIRPKGHEFMISNDVPADDTIEPESRQRPAVCLSVSRLLDAEDLE